MTPEKDVHVFISHAWIDGTDHAKHLYDALTKHGISAWLDLSNMNPFNDFSGEIDRQIKRASHVVVCVTPDIDREDSYVRLEIGYAKGHRKPIIAALFEEIVPPSLMVNNTRAYFNRNWDTAFAQVLDYLGKPRDYEAPADDPFQDYLDSLRQDIEDYLNIAIIREIPLHSQETPGAVQTTATKRMLGSLFDTTLAVKLEEQKPPHAFDSIGDAFLHFSGRMLLLGEPGAGKTITLMTFVRAMLASRLADRSKPLPIFARIADWDGKAALPDWLAGQIPLSREDLTTLIESGKALLALDGLDELGSEREDLATKEKFEPRQRFLSLLPPNTPTLVSCRITDYAEIGQKAALKGAVTLQALDDAQLQDYLSTQPDLWAALQADDGLRDIARTPLLLSLFAYAFNGLDDEAKALHSLTRGDLRDKIFETYVRRRYEHEKLKSNAASLYSLEQITDVLGGIAMENAGNKRANILRREDLNSVPQDLIIQAQKLHLLIQLGDDSYRFIHLLLRDYFAYTTAIRSLRDGTYYKRTLYALGHIGDARAVELLIELINDENSSRFRIAMVLGQFQDARVVEPLIALLRDEEYVVRKWAAMSLGRIADARSVQPLIAALNEPDAELRTWVVVALKRIGTLEALAALEAWQKEHPDKR